MQPDLAPVMPTAPYERVGRLSRLMAVVTLAGVPEWRRVRRAQTALTPIDGPQEFTAVSPTYRTIAGRTIRIADAGHAPWADQPEIYADLVRSFATGAQRQEQPTG